VKRDYLFADISLAVGIVGLVTAAILAWPALTDSSPSSASASISTRNAPAPWMPRIKVRPLP